MTTAISTQVAGMLEQVLVGGDLSKLNPQDRVMYYKQVCESVGLNPLTKPFEYITLNGKLTLYALRSATEQLRQLHGVSVQIVAREVVEDCYVVTARATDNRGRTDESIGAVPIKSLSGEARSNAMMKAETKAKRRVTLSLCGMGMLDETEVDSIPRAAITPTAGYLAAQPADKQLVLNETAQEVKALFANDQAADAYALIENSNLDSEEMIALWSLLPSNIRSAMKRMKAQESAAASGVISPAKHKRLEALIKEGAHDRAALKAWCSENFGKQHFTELTDDEYKELDAYIASTTTTASAQPTLPSAAPPPRTKAAADATITPEQESTLLDLLTAHGVELKAFLERAAVKRVIDLPASKYSGAASWIKEQRK